MMGGTGGSHSVPHSSRYDITSPSFEGVRILGTILFENTMNRTIGDTGSARYLWQSKQVVPFLKVDKGLEEEKDGVQLMIPMSGLEELLRQAASNEGFGTKMRSVIKTANETGVKAIVDEQFEIGVRPDANATAARWWGRECVGEVGGERP